MFVNSRVSLSFIKLPIPKSTDFREYFELDELSDVKTAKITKAAKAAKQQKYKMQEARLSIAKQRRKLLQHCCWIDIVRIRNLPIRCQLID